MQSSLPKVRVPSNTDKYTELVDIVKKENLNTVCQEANCPNIYNCFSKGTLTFMILGNICTRNCSYCDIKAGNPLPPDENEPKRIASVVKKLNLKYVVVTCVTRDDLDDGGASIFAKTVREIKKINPECRVELLISDLNGDWGALKEIVDARPEVIGHNVEVVKELFPKVRPQGNYDRSLELLKNIKNYDSELITKSGLMVGLDETYEQIIQTMKNIRSKDCDIMTIGQYLAPSSKHFPVQKFYNMEEFSFFKKAGESLGFRCVESGPLVRSSFNASQSYENVRRRKCVLT